MFLNWIGLDTGTVIAGTASHPIVKGTCRWYEDDRRRFAGLNEYFGTQNWNQISLNYPSSSVAVTMECFDTLHPTLAPSVAPTTPAPTLAPTEICESIKVTVSGTDAVATYNGIYNKQSSTINGYDWWVARN